MLKATDQQSGETFTQLVEEVILQVRHIVAVYELEGLAVFINQIKDVCVVKALAPLDFEMLNTPCNCREFAQVVIPVLPILRVVSFGRWPGQGSVASLPGFSGSFTLFLFISMRKISSTLIPPEKSRYSSS